MAQNKRFSSDYPTIRAVIFLSARSFITESLLKDYIEKQQCIRYHYGLCMAFIGTNGVYLQNGKQDVENLSSSSLLQPIKLNAQRNSVSIPNRFLVFICVVFFWITNSKAKIENKF